MLIDIVLSDIFINMVNGIKIDENYIYVSLIFSTELFNLIFDMFYVNSKIFELEIIYDKTKSSKNTFTEKNYSMINSMIFWTSF